MKIENVMKKYQKLCLKTFTNLKLFKVFFTFFQNLEPIFFGKSVKISVGVSSCLWMSLERIERMTIVTIYDFRHVHLQSMKNASINEKRFIQ